MPKRGENSYLKWKQKWSIKKSCTQLSSFAICLLCTSVHTYFTVELTFRVRFFCYTLLESGMSSSSSPIPWPVGRLVHISKGKSQWTADLIFCFYLPPAGRMIWSHSKMTCFLRDFPCVNGLLPTLKQSYAFIHSILIMLCRAAPSPTSPNSAKK